MTLKEILELVGALIAIASVVWWMAYRFGTIDTTLSEIKDNHLAHIYKDIEHIHEYMFGKRDGK